MAIKTKTELHSDINTIIVGGGNVTASDLNGILNDVVDSYEDLIQEYTTIQRNALTPFEGQKIYNTTSNRMEYYNVDQWLPVSQKEGTALDCSGNPNYPEGLLGDVYMVTVAGKVGGASGKPVYVGDFVYCIVANGGGTEGSVGTNWKVCYSADASDSPTRLAELTIATAQVLTLNGTPQTLVAAPGAGKMIVAVSPIIVTMDYNSVPYATNTNMTLFFDDDGFTIFDLSQASDYFTATPFDFSHDVYDNIAFKIKVSGGNPTAGNSDVKVKLFYKIITL